MKCPFRSVAVDRDVMRQAVGFASRPPFIRQGQDGDLPDEVRRGIVLVQVCKDWSERVARVQLHRGRWSLCVHVHHEMRVRRKEGHLTVCITAIGAVRIRLDELADRKAVGRFIRRDSEVFAHEASLL